MANYENFQVAILTDSIEKAQLLSSYLRKWSIIPYVFTDLSEFIKVTSKEVPHLSLIEVDMASAGELTIGSHPKYQDGILNCAAFCTNETIPLMATTYEYNMVGFFNIDASSLASRLRNIIEAAISRNKIYSENMSLKKEVHVQKERNFKLMERVQEFNTRSDYDEVLNEFIAKLDQNSTQMDFYQALESVIQECEWVENFSILEPNINGKKLISPHLKSQKFVACPSLWLGSEDNLNGIKQYAQNLGHQVIQDYLGDEFVTMGVKVSGYDHPHALIYMNVDKDFKACFNWQLFQALVSGFYCRSLLGDQLRNIKPGQQQSEWEFYDLLTQENVGELGLKKAKLYLLDFDKLFNAINENPQTAFQWRNFYNQFTAQLSAKVNCDFKFCIMHSSFIGFYINSIDAHEFENIITGFYKKFAYWRFFDDPDHVLAKDLSPRIRILAPQYDEVMEYVGKKQNQLWQGQRKEKLEDLIDELYEVRRPISEV